MLLWAKHRFAPWCLGIVSFAESSFFPIPPDVMLMPMVLARPPYWLRFATITTVTSVLGGALGYAIGYWGLEAIIDWLSPHNRQTLETAQRWFAEWGVWTIFIAGFSPIPYKLFTIAGGVMHMAFLPFLVASLVGRGSRFFLVAAIVRFASPHLEPILRRYIEHIGWALTGLLLLAIIVSLFVS